MEYSIDSEEMERLLPIFANFVGIHRSPEEFMLILGVRERDPQGEHTGKVDPVAKFCVPRDTARRLFLALQQEFDNPIDR
jgi:hypothetical protein